MIDGLPIITHWSTLEPLGLKTHAAALLTEQRILHNSSEVGAQMSLVQVLNPPQNLPQPIEPAGLPVQVGYQVGKAVEEAKDSVTL